MKHPKRVPNVHQDYAQLVLFRFAGAFGALAAAPVVVVTQVVWLDLGIACDQ